MLMLQGGGADMPVRLLVPTAVLLAWQREIVPLVRGNCHEQLTTFSDGCLGSINDEGRSEVR